ncbi:hypothetical protein MTQ10_20670 [Streptomyces sp. XM83C]|uniref:PLL-like beta propeller domain-containing protein n=1 Tax=Streptomyces thermocoprophilus TaxID=78356 RepID=A0ABV5VEB1_9ACTN|nr:hypothetical protein [Streptomyces sp. XM83C]MCK1821959.1 hypothetical protein [Streptomyces sp. XM83C]
MNGEWLICGRDGRLSVYQLSGDFVLCRAERVPGGPWDAPRRIGGDQRVRPVLAIGQGIDSYGHLISWGPDTGLVHSTHFRPLLAPLDWHPIAHPDGKGDESFEPAVAVDHQGRAHVFVRNAAGGLNMRAQALKGGWGPWRDLKGADLQGAPAAAAGKDGRIEVYVAARGAVLYGRQPQPATVFELEETVEARAVPGTLKALATSEENTTLFFVDEDGRLCAWRPGSKPVELLDAAGTGRIAAVRCELDGQDCTLLAQRSATGGVSFAAFPSEQEWAGASWTRSGAELPPDVEVSLALDSDGRVVAAAQSPSTGALFLARRKDEPGLALTPWQAV